MPAFKPTFKPAQKPVAAAVASVGKKPAAGRAAAAVESGPFEVQAKIAYAASLIEPDDKTGMRSCLLYITDEESIDAVNRAVAAKCLETFGEEDIPEGGIDPRRDANEADRANNYSFKHPIFREGGMILRAKTKFEVSAVWGPNETEIDVSEITGGDEVVATINLYGYNNQSTGVGVGLNKLWLISKGKVKVERGSGGSGANVVRIDRSKLKFGGDAAGEGVEA